MTHRPARRRATLLVLCAVGALLVSACSSGTSSASGTPAAQSAAAQSAQVRMSGGYVMNEDGTLQQPETNATVPKLNSAALQFTPAGAELAARHFLALTEYAWATGDTQPMKDFSSADCKPCLEMADNIDRLYEANGWTKGVRYEIAEVTRVDQVVGLEGIFGIDFVINNSAYDVYADGTLSQTRESVTNMTLFMHWLDSQWEVFDEAADETD